MSKEVQADVTPVTVIEPLPNRDTVTETAPENVPVPNYETGQNVTLDQAVNPPVLAMSPHGPSLAQVAYDGYYRKSNGLSLVSGAPLPTFDKLAPEIVAAWDAAAVAVGIHITPPAA